MDFFIVGTSRSGSTLLRNILNGHPDVAVLNESHWLPHIHETMGVGPAPVERFIEVVENTYWDTGQLVIDANVDWSDTTHDDVLQRVRDRLQPNTTVAAFHGEVVDALFNQNNSKSIRGDKTPDYGFYMRSLQDIWPDVRFVHVVRNGLDTAASMTQHGGCRLMVANEIDCWCPLAYDRRYRAHRTRRRLPRAAFVASWRRRMEHIRHEAEFLTEGSYLEVRYEDLLNDAESVLRQTADFLAIDTTDEWLRASASTAVSRNPTSHDESTFIEFGLADLRALAEIGAVDYLLFGPGLEPTELDEALAQCRQALDRGDDQLAVQIGISLLAVGSSGPDGSIEREAVELVCSALARLRSRRAALSWSTQIAAELDRCGS